MESYSEQDYRDVILAQQQTIDILQKKLDILQKRNITPYNHSAGKIFEAVGTPMELDHELVKMIDYMFFKRMSQSEMIEKIEVAPITLRDKLYACHLTGQAFANVCLKGGLR